MTHIMDVSGTHEALFHLRHLASGSRDFCRGELLHFGADDYSPEEWETYQGQLTFLVSRSLINCAINLRLLQDTLRSQSSASELSEAESDYGLREDLNLGEVLAGNFALTLRESCNKVIHATKLSLLFSESRTGKPARRYSYWNGHVYISGEQSKCDWAASLNVAKWCTAVETYVQCFWGYVEWGWRA
jgi:hypothetical protein